MQTEVYNNIDTLIEMSGSSTNVEEISTELISLRRLIKNKKSEIDDLKSIMDHSRYFNASNELVDKNIEISLKNKIARLSRKLKEIEEVVKDISGNEEKVHNEISDLRAKLSKNENYVSILEAKANSSLANEYYINLLKEEKDNVESLTNNLNEKISEHESILKELELNNQATTELKTKLANEETRLSDILDNLSNPNAYIDEDLKSSDEAKLQKLEEEKAELDKRELEILTNAGIIGMDAKELIASGDIDEALNKIKELVTIVKTKPFMDITSASLLDEELDKKEAERIELSNLIDSKSYEGMNSEAIKNRIDYLNKEIESNNSIIAKLEQDINALDEFNNNTLGSAITSIEKEVLAIDEAIKNYKELLKEKNTLKGKTNLEQAILKKEKERSVLDEILASYKQDLLDKIDSTNKKSEEINSIRAKNSKYESELDDLQKINITSFQTKDLMEEEKDKENLKKLNEEIKEIKNRKKYDKTPNEIYDQIEMVLASIKPVKPKQDIDSIKEVEEITNNEEKSINENNEPPVKKDNLIKVIEMIPVETVKSSGGVA